MSDETPPAELVAGKYKLTRLLGRGGMGSVWEGVHETLGNRVACKFIEPEFVSSLDAVTRFENEARAAASLKSKHVVDVYDHGVMPDGRPYIVMEFLEGEPLDARINKVGALNIQQTATIVLQVSRALARAHQTGIVHRDLKPENVFLVWDDEDQTDVVKVVDFGIAKFTDSEASGISSATKTGSILGTPYYMSPEQARGLKNLDARSDNWSLGVIAYECLTGVRPFDGEAVGDLLVKICTTDPIPPSGRNPSLPPDLDEWMARALNREADQRFQDVREMAESLVTVAGLPGRGTLGSAIGGSHITGTRDSSDSVDRLGVTTAATTQAQGSPKLTSGAVTHAAVGGDAVPVTKTNPMLFAGAAVLVLGLIGGAIAMSGGEESPADAEALDTSEAGKDHSPAAATPEEKLPEPEPKTKPEPAPTPEPTPVEIKPATPPAPKPAATPSVAPRPKPRPAPPPTPAPKPAPPAPTPKPQPASGALDLGY